MPDAGRVLIVDDEVTFLESTADLLRREGYRCHTERDSTSAEAEFQRRRYDLVIADIRMPGNSGLEFVRRLAQADERVPVILVTGYPSLNSAVESVGLPVVAYLVKPFEFGELSAKVRLAMGMTHVNRVVRRELRRLTRWRRSLSEMERSLRQGPRTVSGVPVRAFISLSMSNIVRSLGDLDRLVNALSDIQGQREVCPLFSCTRLEHLNELMRETVAVLEKTKGSFKSKELAELRKRIESALTKEQEI